jgi:hypothetical protein
MNRRIRTAIAVLAVLSTLSITGVAFAKPVAGRTPVPAVQVVTDGSAASVSGASTGDGPATDEECQDYAEDIEAAGRLSDFFAGRGDYGAALAQLEDAQDVEDKATDEGCFILYTPDDKPA